MLEVRADVARAVRDGEPVVALESTLIAHGLPYPDNLDVARELEDIVREEGAVPATAGVIGGAAVVGLDAAGIRRMAEGGAVAKVAARDLPVIAATGGDGATTVSATAVLAVAAGVRVLATGGLGGVHRDARDTWDESADLTTLAAVPVVVVCAGVKSILDVPATLERLETLGVPVVGYRTPRFPGFYRSDSGASVDWTVTTPHEAALVARAMERLGARHGLVVANPIPESEQLDPDLHDRIIEQGLAESRRREIHGKAVTPFLLSYLHTHSGGASLAVNAALVRHNARLAARIAAALAGD
jgi:pseudouridylate synthase